LVQIELDRGVDVEKQHGAAGRRDRLAYVFAPMDFPAPMPPAHDSHFAQPHVLTAMRRDLTNTREWLARIVVMVYAALAGGSVVAFTWLSNIALHGFNRVLGVSPWLPFALTPAICALVAWITVRFFPGAAGSGIPQVMAALDPAVTARDRPGFVSFRLAVAKIALTVTGLFGGLAIGREGPSVQIAAGVMLHARRWLPAGASIRPHGLLVAGGAAGIAATFNAPLAGVMFAIEELSSKMEQRSSGLVVAAIVLAGMVGVSTFGNATYFGVIRVPSLELRFFWPALLVVMASGLLGGFFSRLLHASLVGRIRGLSRWRAAHPVWFAGACGIVIAAIGWASGGASFGSGYDSTRHLLEGHTTVPLTYVASRFVATWLASWSGVPGGLFAPALAIGAGVGSDVAVLTGWQADAPALIALGMAGFLAAVTQAPITAFIIVMEMVDGHSMVLTLMAGALGASLIARWLARPLYGALAQAQLARLAASRPAAAPRSGLASPD
jgi:H+/Cl- antiporter ClcA